ncbi:MAG TPA: GlpM family protein [Rickettsiales bacterium]|nr:GlpM family protein [Rickettsiales bacterium]
MLALKAAIGAVIMVLIALLSNSRSYYIAGLLPLFPTFTLIAHYSVGVQRSHGDLKQTIIFSMCAVVPYMVYLISSYYLLDKMSLKLALTSAALLWCLAAAGLLFIWPYIKG